MTEFVVRSDSGEMPGSKELKRWCDDFCGRYGFRPLEYKADTGTWRPFGRGSVAEREYRLNSRAREILQRLEAESEDEPEGEWKLPDVHLARVFAEIRRSLYQAERSANVELGDRTQELTEARAALTRAEQDIEALEALECENERLNFELKEAQAIAATLQSERDAAGLLNIDLQRKLVAIALAAVVIAVYAAHIFCGL